MKVDLILSKDFQVCKIDDRIYSSFVEHMGRSVYNGIYEPTHPTADANGFREDVKELIKPLNIPMIRYPGGNFLSGYRWEDGVGPRSERPRVLDPAWKQLEPNEVGTDEFHAWAEEMGAEVMMAVNLGTRGTEEAGQLLEYCNLDTDSKYANMRVKNGRKKAYKDPVWCLGNEMDGPWQIGARTPEDYADIARKTANYMKKIDPDAELVACGSSKHIMKTFGEWETVVLNQCYDQVDYISLHLYITDFKENDAEYLGASVGMDQFIRTVISICDAVGGRLRSSKKVNLAFDEWNVQPKYTKCDNKLSPWEIGPAREEYRFCLLDALVFGTMMNSLLRHADRVKIACFAQLVNVCAPIMTVNGGIAWKQTTYYPFYYASNYGRGILLDQRLNCPTYEAGKYGEAPYVDTVAVYRPEEKEICIFAINRSENEAAELKTKLGEFGKCSLIEHVVLESDDPHARNSETEPDRVTPKTVTDRAKVCDGAATVDLKPLTWNMIRIKTEQ